MTFDPWKVKSCSQRCLNIKIIVMVGLFKFGTLSVVVAADGAVGSR